jgi:hypothetical protein
MRALLTLVGRRPVAGPAAALIDTASSWDKPVRPMRSR